MLNDAICGYVSETPAFSLDSSFFHFQICQKHATLPLIVLKTDISKTVIN